MKTPDPFAALAVDLVAENKAQKAQRARKAKETLDAIDGPIEAFEQPKEMNMRENQMSIPGTERRENRAADDRLRLLIERIERLEEEKKGIADDIRDVFGEAKSTGYDVKAMRAVIKIRKIRPDDRREMEAILDTYKSALGID